MSSVGQQDVKALEQTRQRLFQLTHSLASLQQNILQSELLPPWASLQSLASIISQNLTSVSQHLSTNHDLFTSMVAYPLPTFPGRTQENLLGQLLRKKLEPDVEDWVLRGRATATEAINLDGRDLKEHDLLALWEWAGMAANEQARKHTWGGDFTLEEREMGVENVDTGLRRMHEESGDESSNDDTEPPVDFKSSDDDMKVVGVRPKPEAAGVEFEITKESEHISSAASSRALPMDEVFRFMMTGVEPSHGNDMAAGSKL